MMSPPLRGVLAATVAALLCSAAPRAQGASSGDSAGVLIVRAARILDVRAGKYIEAGAVYIEGERIQAVGRAADVESRAPPRTAVLDLGDAVLLPGLIDCHTHMMARMPDGEFAYEINLLTKSQAYRALEGAANARQTLAAGFTTVRDVESEGAGYADAALRDAINDGLVEGPRMRVATRGIAAVGEYYPFHVAADIVGFPTGAQMISGTEEARRAVREQIGHGADLIKVYADWTHPTLTVEEMRVVVEEAHKAGRKVAAHATTAEGIRNAVMAGVDSIEHGHRASREDLVLMRSKGVYLVPTLSGLDAGLAKNPARYQSPRAKAFVESVRQTLTMAKALGVKIADGSDPDSAEAHGRNAQELESMARRGLTPLEAIRAATLAAADLIGWPDDVGALETGKFADLIAVRGDPLVDLGVLEQVAFVMKGGRIIKDTLTESRATNP